AARHLARIGFDRTVGFLVGALAGWATGGRSFRSLPAVSVTEVARRVADSPEDWTLLDVRSASEIAGGMITGSCHRYVGELGNHLDTLRHDHRYTVMCGSGQRATIAASVLLRAGFSRVDVFLGSMGAWQAAGYPTIKAEDSICQ
ncbi:MAG: rhodanese-like domain-containing protein, partial [Aquisalimonadaceae bacterium]